MRKKKEKEKELLNTLTEDAVSDENETVEEALKEAAENAEAEKAEDEKAEPEKAEGEDPKEKMEADIALFHSLFPETKAESIPQEVWDRVEKGESLAASFALYTVMKEKEEEKIRAVNAENEKKAPPRIRHDGAEAEYFSPEAVKSMTRKEIKENYDAILRSMEKWN